MDEDEWLAERFEEHRPHLRAVAYRMLGSLTEADDAVQDTWLRLSRAGASEVENLGGWLTTIVARVCLNMLRSRNTRREDLLGVHMPDPVISPTGAAPGGGGVAGRLGRPGAARRARHPLAGGAAGVRAARHVRPAVRGDRADGRPDARRRRGSSPAGRGVASRARRPRRPIPISPASARWSTPSSGPRAAATSTRWSPCSTPTSCCDPTSAPSDPRAPGDPWRGGRGQPGADSRRFPAPCCTPRW